MNYGFGCGGLNKPSNPLGRRFGYIETLRGTIKTDSGISLRGSDGTVDANAAQRAVFNAAKSYPSECFVTSRCKTCS